MSQPCSSARGFTLIEVLMVAMVLATVTGMALMVLPGVLEATKADSGTSQLETLLRSCREQAITQRRNMQVVFVDPDRAQCLRRELQVDGLGVTTESGVLTLVQEVILEQGMTYLRFAGVNPADTPNAFSPGVASRDFTGAAPWWFTPEGTFVDANGDVTNGTVFLGRPQQIDTARAVTVFGSTALLETWRWNGSEWVN
jgi:prepilin-type N-terminal cleavage/methylation domain-containing protein